MKYTDIEIDGMDIDWFAIDRFGFVAHFATGGGRPLPRPIMDSVEDNDNIFAYFSNIKSVTEIIKMPEVKLFKTFKSPIEEENYYAAFSMARKGIFTFDAIINKQHQNIYCCVNKPVKTISSTEIPVHLLEKLRMYTYSGNFSKDILIDENLLIA